MGKRKNVWTGGYSDDFKRELDMIKLPEEIVCCVCQHLCTQQLYSENQLSHLRHAIYLEGNKVLINQDIAKCILCCNTQSVERMCFLCGTTKGIDEFSRNQRLKEDAACQDCVEFMQTVTPSEDALLARDPDGLDDHERRPESPEYIEGVDYEIRFPSSNNDHTMNVASRNMDDSNWSVDAASSVGESRNASRWIKVNPNRPPVQPRAYSAPSGSEQPHVPNEHPDQFL